MDFRNDILPHRDRLFRLAFSITLNRADAEDIVQETMLLFLSMMSRRCCAEATEQSASIISMALRKRFLFIIIKIK